MVINHCHGKTGVGIPSTTYSEWQAYSAIARMCTIRDNIQLYRTRSWEKYWYKRHQRYIFLDTTIHVRVNLKFMTVHMATI